jgi:hypothetical protein
VKNKLEKGTFPMKRRASFFSISVVVLAVAVYAILALTGKVPPPIKNLQNTLSGTASLSGEALYEELCYNIKSPDSKTSIDGKITFTALVIGDSEETTFEDDDKTYHYQAAVISRCDDYFLLEVSKLPEALKTGEYYSVTGTLNGTVYWTEDNEKKTVLDIEAKDAKPFEPTAAKVNEGPRYTTGQGVYTFRGAHMSRNLQGECIVVYFDFENTTNRELAPDLSGLELYQGDSEERSSSSVVDADDKDSKALNARAGLGDKTYAGKTSRYYAVYRTQDAEEGASVMHLVRFNDDFQLTDEIAIPIAKTLKDWQDWQK